MPGRLVDPDASYRLVRWEAFFIRELGECVSNSVAVDVYRSITVDVGRFW